MRKKMQNYSPWEKVFHNKLKDRREATTNQQSQLKKKLKFELKEKVSLHDPESKTCIKNFLESYDNDPLVSEYVDKLCKNIILPIPPDPDFMAECLSLKGFCGLTQVTKIDCLNDFCFFFQSIYFSHNVQGATDNSVALFNPKVNFNIPQFQLLPKVSLGSKTV